MAKPKLSDVAALAGVSPTTVLPRVLNSRGYLSESTAPRSTAGNGDKYRPNAIARSLQNALTDGGLIFPGREPLLR